MKKKAAAGLGPLITEVRRLIQSARRGAASVVNTLQVMTNFEIGRRIVQYEQKGKKRAGYGDLVVRSLAGRLTREFGRGFSKRNLDYMRRFFLDYSGRLRIVQKPSAQFSPRIQQTLSAELVPALISETPSRKSPFTLSWSHYVLLLTIKNEDERQKASALYERLALSRDKAGVKRLAERGQIITKPEDVLKEPYVLEFLGLDEKAGYGWVREEAAKT